MKKQKERKIPAISFGKKKAGLNCLFSHNKLFNISIRRGKIYMKHFFALGTLKIKWETEE